MTDEFNKKVLMTSFLVIGILAGLVCSILLSTLGATWGVVARALGSDLFRHGVPISVALTLFLFLQLSPSIKKWGDDVVHEIRKVVWPTRPQTVAATIYVCFFVLISGIGFGIFDFVSSYLFNKVLH